MSKPTIEVHVNNNPPCEAALESVMKNEIWNIKNQPYLSLSGKNFENGIREIKVTGGNEILYEGSTVIKDHAFDVKIELETPMADLKTLEITVGEQCYEMPIKLSRIYGKVKYFDGSPIKNPIINITGKEIAAVGDDQGNFEIYLCGKETQIGVFQEDYSKETLEAWIYNIDLAEDTELNISIDKMEVYGIHMWTGEVSDYLHFIPMSLSRIQNAMKQGVKSELEILGTEGVWPTLNKSDVTVLANEEEVKILSFQEIPDFLTEHDNKVYSRPGYVISIPKGHRNKVIKIEINDEVEVENETITEKGEGYYIWR